MNSEGYILGIDLGGSSIKAAAMTAAGELLAQQNVPFVDRDKEWAMKTRTLVKQFQAGELFSTAQKDELGGAPALQCIGLSAPGLAAADGRSIASMPGRLFGLEGLDWTNYLGAAQPVRVLNDAHAALLGEAWLGAARGLRNVCLLTLGTGVGGAAMVDGHLLRGALGRAGHLGHTVVDWLGPLDSCNAPGSLELFIGNKSVRERTGGRFETTLALVTAVQSGDKEAGEMWLKSVRALACAVASFVNILDPEAVIVGGGIARAGKSLFEPLQKFLDEVEWRPGGRKVQLLPAQLGDMAGAFGSAANALKKFD